MNKLVLYPRDPNVSEVESEILERTLRTSGLIGREIDAVGQKQFRPGDRFPSLIEFGLADPAAVAPRVLRCTVTIPEALGEIGFLGGANFAAPSCACGSTLTNVGEVSWNTAIPCRCCGLSPLAHELDWHRTAAFGRYAIDIRGIELGEAVPAARLLTTLEETNGVAWDYFYYTGA